MIHFKFLFGISEGGIVLNIIRVKYLSLVNI